MISLSNQFILEKKVCINHFRVRGPKQGGWSATDFFCIDEQLTTSRGGCKFRMYKAVSKILSRSYSHLLTSWRRAHTLTHAYFMVNVMVKVSLASQTMRFTKFLMRMGRRNRIHFGNRLEHQKRAWWERGLQRLLNFRMKVGLSGKP